ncbi:MAG TPA: oligoendopeptidase F [Lentimicrobium sp.]|nr:oligoendopeptidase F [Lentimicrobium sp.]
MRKIYLLLFAMLSLNLVNAGDPVTRENAPENAKWRLTDIYATNAAWAADLQKADQLMKEVVSMKGTLGTSSENLLRYFTVSDEFGKVTTKLYCYAYLQRSLDSRDPSINDQLQRIQAFMSTAGQQLAWVQPEMVTIPEEKAMKWVELNPAFQPYKFSLENMYRLQQHVLPADQEQLVSYFSTIAELPSAVYTEVAISDNEYPQFVRSNGDKVSLTRPMFTNILTFSTDRDERRRAYEDFSALYKGRENTMAAILHGVSKTDKAYAQAYKFDNTLEASLNSNNIPVSVYENLIKVARENPQPLQRYINLRKKVLKLDDYSPWDGNIPLGTFNRTYEYDEAKEIIRKALIPLGKEYSDGISKALNGGWIDVYEGAAKETGAYSMGVYGVHPYILLNYDKTTRAVSTMAHELGHTMHSMFSMNNQPYKNHDYSTFVAEVASNFNEELLLDYMITNASGKDERIALLDQAINNLIGSFYRQSMFADFELQVHRLTEKDEPVNATALNAIMHDLNTAYYGNTVTDNPYRDNVWAQVMHFYQLPYYVYNYATSYAAAARIHQMITNGSKEEKEKALKAYITLLKSGGNDYPVELLKKAGVDMTTTEPTTAVVNRLNELIDKLEKELQS